MNYQALYRKYRPSTFDEVVGQEQNIVMLKNAVIHKQISHAYIFSGPRGTGKTTMAKIFAKMVNCQNINSDGTPCNNCISCKTSDINNDVIEMDAASNNGVDEIREIKNKINLSPSNSKYKIYIIDEVHMMTTQAFNALLKTLEEPPQHIIFILATTEYYKIPQTICSRCQKFQFSKISEKDIIKKLKYILEKENKKTTDDLLNEIAVVSEGGLRDAINLLDQLLSYKNDNLTISDLYEINKTVSKKSIFTFLSLVKQGNKEKIIKEIEKYEKEGNNIQKFIEQMFECLKKILIYKTGINKNIDNQEMETIAKLYSEKEIYSLILNMNELEIKSKNSNYASILFITYLLKWMDENLIEIQDKKNFIINKNTDDDSKNLKTETTENKKQKSVEEKNQKIIDNQKIIINNALATANKQKLIELQYILNNLDEHIIDENPLKYLIKDLNLVVVGEGYLIMTSKQKLIIDKSLKKYDELFNQLAMLFNNKYEVAYITEIEWNKQKKEYIKNIKNNKKYITLPLNIVDHNNINQENKKIRKPNEQNKLIDILGEELIEYK